ncbi:hypothetical protein EV426DRAFT_679865 [Tirmania nivea]|nr:hypothetical protein EV426DRAFT_679865 [Tirmania nivea]
MALIAAGGSSRSYYFSMTASNMPTTTAAASRQHPRVESTPIPPPHSAAAGGTAGNLAYGTSLTAARDAYSSPPHSDSDPPLASSSPASCLPYAVLTPAATQIKSLCTTSDLQTLPMHLFPAPNAKPQLPHTILDLTPKLLLCLARDSCIQQRRFLASGDTYDERNNSFIIRCMPSPVHKSISEGLSWNILQAVYCSIKVNPILNGIHVHTNRDITELGPTKNSSRCPDLQIEVQTTQQDIFISGIIVEVGFSQSLASLHEKATGWFQDLPDLHMCILVDITEQAQEYVDSAGQKISKSKAKKVQNEWPDWLMRDASSTLTLKEEIVRRIGGGMIKTKAEGEQVLVGIKEDLRKWLLEKDEQEVLIPALVEPMDATIYVYARAGNDELEQVDSDGQVGDGQVGNGQVGDGQVGD